MSRRRASCHPSEAHIAFGLCRLCYDRRHTGARPKQKGIRPADCHPDRPNHSRGLCRPCQRALRPTPADIRRGRRHLLATYGLGEADYERMVVAQGGRCAVCARAPKPGKRLCIDHDHKSGDVRGLLCHRCNRGIGLLRDDPTILDTAAAYVRRSA